VAQRHAHFMQFALGLLIGLAFPALALADAQTWRYAKWGMSPEEVIAASNGQASPVPFTSPTPDSIEKPKQVSQLSGTPSQEPLRFEGAKSQLEDGGIFFKVSFVFDEQARKLIQVIVSTDKCALDTDLIRYRLIKDYGKPADHHKSDSTTWKTNSEMIKYDVIKKKPTSSANCAIRYEPLPKP
jgi:hypothetical protein